MTVSTRLIYFESAWRKVANFQPPLTLLKNKLHLGRCAGFFVNFQKVFLIKATLSIFMFQVASVASVALVSLTPFIVKDVKRPAFPLGVNVFFGVTLHDKMGRLFDVSNVPLKHRASRLVEITSF